MHRFWGLLFGVVLLASFVSFCVAPFFGWWLPRDVSTYGAAIDRLFYIILAITAFFFIVTEVVLVYCMLKYPYKQGQKSTFSHGNHNLELLWAIIPGVILFVLAIIQINAWAEVKFVKNMPKPDGNTLQMEVLAKQWEWRMRYPSSARMESWEKDPKLAMDFGANPHQDDLKITNEIHVWKDQKTLIHLKTSDVIHSLFLPNLRLKQDALPGRTIPVWFAAQEYNTERSANSKVPQWTEIGYDPATGKASDPEKIWELTCAEFCGARHSMMRGKLYVHKDKADFKAWLKHMESEQNRTQPGTPTNLAAR